MKGRRKANLPKSVVLLIETSNSFSRGILNGIRKWMKQHEPWDVYLMEQGRGEQPPLWLNQWKGDGIIARIENPSIETAVRRTKSCVINVSAANLAPEFPVVRSDSAALAQVAALHFIERGLQNFGYCGDPRRIWAQEHGEHFVSLVTKRGFRCQSFEISPEELLRYKKADRRLLTWLKSLPKPAGVFVGYDIRGQQVLSACRAGGIRVPEEISVVSQHNDETLCELCNPPLSSVIPDSHQIGLLAASLLNDQMNGRKVPAMEYLVPPVGIQVRRSSDTLAFDDPQVAAAMRFMQTHACECISIDDVLNVVPICRTLLQRRFKSQTGRTPYEQIRHFRLQEARKLLASTNMTIAEIALQTGFRTTEYFNAAFRKEEGLPPGQYRRKLNAAQDQSVRLCQRFETRSM